MYNIRTYNAISSKGLDRFSADNYTVSEDCAAPEGFILRSQKLHSEPVPLSLLAVARAGAGVNNIPVADYTEQGIVVFLQHPVAAQRLAAFQEPGLITPPRRQYRRKHHMPHQNWQRSQSRAQQTLWRCIVA